MKIKGIIYGAFAPSGKIYVGQTIQKLRDRLYAHKFYPDCRLIHNAIKKYGDKIEWKVIDTAETIDELNKKEVYWIKKLNTLAPNGYNLMSGGLNSKHSNETKAKMSAARIGKPAVWNRGKIPYNKGKRGLYKHSIESLQKISKANKGKNNPMYSKKRSSETKLKIANTLKIKYANGTLIHPLKDKEMSSEARAKMSLSAKKRCINDSPRDSKGRFIPKSKQISLV